MGEVVPGNKWMVIKVGKWLNLIFFQQTNMEQQIHCSMTILTSVCVSVEESLCSHHPQVLHYLLEL